MEYISIGHTGKPHGVKGELRFYTEEALLPFLEGLPAVFLEEKGQFLPYFLERLHFGSPARLELEDINSREAAQRLAGREVFARQKDLDLPPELFDSSSQLEYDHLMGYQVIDAEQGDLGRIQAIEAYPQQEIAVVQKGEQEWLLPLTEAFIQAVEEETQRLLVLLPEGLADI